MSQEHSAEWLRGAVFMAECLGDERTEEQYKHLLAAAEAALLRATQAEAQAGRRKEALEDERSPLRLCEPSCQDGAVTRCMCRHCVDGRSKAALAETPAQSLARHDIEILRKVIAEADKRRGSIIMAFGDVCPGDILGIVTEMIDRLEQEAAGGEVPHA